MSNLNSHRVAVLEEILKMRTGYVLDFSNRSFEDFFQEYLNIDINDQKYLIRGESKANRLRTFVRLESNFLVLKLLKTLREIYQLHDPRLDEIIEWLSTRQEIYLDSFILNNFKSGNANECIEALSRSVRAGKPSEALDRLHTFAMNILINLYGDKNKEIPLHCLYIQLINKFKFDEEVHNILKSEQPLLEQLNNIRNNKSLAHANQPFNENDEAIYIIKRVFNLFEFLLKKCKN